MSDSAMSRYRRARCSTTRRFCKFSVCCSRARRNEASRLSERADTLTDGSGNVQGLSSQQVLIETQLVKTQLLKIQCVDRKPDGRGSTCGRNAHKSALHQEAKYSQARAHLHEFYPRPSTKIWSQVSSYRATTSFRSARRKIGRCATAITSRRGACTRFFWAGIVRKHTAWLPVRGTPYVSCPASMRGLGHFGAVSSRHLSFSVSAHCTSEKGLWGCVNW